MEPSLKRKREEPGERINSLPAFLMDNRCSVCFTTLYQDLSLHCFSHENCKKGAHLMCVKCMESYFVKYSKCARLKICAFQVTHQNLICFTVTRRTRQLCCGYTAIRSNILGLHKPSVKHVQLAILMSHGKNVTCIGGTRQQGQQF